VVTRADAPDDTAPAGEVTAQDPQAGETAKKGDKITLTVSSGKGKATVPDVSGKDDTDAAAELGQAGFKVAKKQEPSATVDSGKVIRTEPAAGTEATKGDTVTMIVSSGQQNVDVPNVVGMSEEAAKQTLADAGFEVSVKDEIVADPSDVGVVINQTPDGGEQAPQGSTVTITVGRPIQP
jgi:serine/threonine-protein kinase